jgi:spore coat protein CotH
MMTVQRHLFVLAAALAFLVGAVPRAAEAQTADDVFDAGTLHEIRLLINSKDLDLLRINFADNTYYPADLVWGSQRVRNVGIRSRGSGSRNGGKLGLRVDFDRYTSDQRFAGLASLALDNLVQDPSMVRERVAMSFFNRIGVPAPRESFCRLFINNEYHGVYAIVEEIEPPFVARTLGEDSGYLFEYHWVSEFRGQDLGDISAYKPLFEPRNHENDADSVIYGAIADLFREAATSDATTRQRIEQFLDIPSFIVQIAAENFLAENDGVLGYAGMNNLYLYRLAGTTQQRFLPWDKDNTFLQTDFPITIRLDDNALSRQLLASDDLKALYFETLDRCARVAADGDWLFNEIATAAALIADAAHQDTRKFFSNDEFDAGVEFLKGFAVERPGFVLASLAAIR